MIVDIHTHHVVGVEKTPDFQALRRLLAVARRAHIDRLCLLGNVFMHGLYPGKTQTREINDVTIAMVRRFPERLVGFCYLNPANGARFVKDEVERCLGSGLRGIKLETSVNVRDKRLRPVMEIAAATRIPVMQHTWYKTVSKHLHESDPSDVAFAATRYPGTTIIMAHAVGCGIRGILDVQRLPNVYVDTSGSQPVAGIVEYAVQKLGARRVLFGSDACGRDFACQLGKVLGAHIGKYDRRQILGENAERLLRL